MVWNIRFKGCAATYHCARHYCKYDCILVREAVFHHSDSELHSQAVGNIKNFLEDETIDLEAVALVANSSGFGLLKKDSDHRDAIAALQERSVVFKQCENTLEGTNVNPDEFLDGVELVSSGVGELTRLQSNGYAYIVP